MVLQPVGPLPASVYWRRRLVLLGGLVVLALLLRSCAGGDSPTAKLPEAKATPSASPTASPTPAPTRPPATAAGLCADGVVELTTSTDAASYPVGSSPKITLTIVNTGTTPCRRDVGGAAVELRVVSGSDRVWSSDDCSLGQVSSVEELKPGVAKTVVKTWPGVRSAPQCGGSKAQAKNGTYRVVARVGTKQLEGAVFRLTG